MLGAARRPNDRAPAGSAPMLRSMAWYADRASVEADGPRGGQWGWTEV
jgi:hypothetical protein